MPVMIKPHYRGRQLERGGGGGELRRGWLTAFLMGRGSRQPRPPLWSPPPGAVANRSLPIGVGRGRA